MNELIIITISLLPTLLFIIIYLVWLQYGVFPGEDLIQDIREWKQKRKKVVK